MESAQNAARTQRIHRMLFSSVYPLYIQKVERKGRAKADLDAILCWLTGYTQSALLQQIERKTDFQTFFAEAPSFHPNASKIKGVICGERVEDITDDIVRKVRQLDKLVDELANGKAMEKILRP